MLRPSDLTRAQLENIVDAAQRELWLTDDGGGSPVWDANTGWSWERVEAIAGVMIEHGLRPADGEITSALPALQGKGAHASEKPPRVVIRVEGGMAEFDSATAPVEVVIRDYDPPKVDDGDYATDECGRFCAEDITIHLGGAP